MKVKNVIYCLLAFCILALSSCGPENDDSVDKIVGEYKVNVTPNLNVKLSEGTVLPVAAETIATTGKVEAVDEDGNVIIMIDGLQGEFSEISFDAYYDGLRLNIENNHYEGIIYTQKYGAIYCDVNLKNPMISIYNSTTLSWESTVSGTCEINVSGLDNMMCDVSGKISFEAIEK